MLLKILLFVPIVLMQMPLQPMFEGLGKLGHYVSQLILSFFLYMDRHFHHTKLAFFFSLKVQLDDQQLFLQEGHLGTQTKALRYQHSCQL